MDVNNMGISGETALRICIFQLHPSSLSIKIRSKKGGMLFTRHKMNWKVSDSEHNVVGLVTHHVLSAVEYNEADSWIVDSGATCHISNNK